MISTLARAKRSPSASYLTPQIKMKVKDAARKLARGNIPVHDHVLVAHNP